MALFLAAFTPPRTASEPPVKNLLAAQSAALPEQMSSRATHCPGSYWRVFLSNKDFG